MNESIAAVPRERWDEALELLLSPLPDELRAKQQVEFRAALTADASYGAGLLASFHDGVLMAVCWLQPQPGRTATFWPPIHARHEEPATAMALTSSALDMARHQDVVLVQSLLVTDAGSLAETLRHAAFCHVADLLYLVSIARDFPSTPPEINLSFVPVSQVEPHRLESIIEQTYHSTFDCPALNEVRAIDDVLAGYRAVGRFRTDLWLIAQRENQDVGCLLLADYSPERLWEVVYMGVVPEARGAGLGIEMTRYAQWLAAREQIERLVLAVDAANEPAIATYAAAGFVAWDRRSVFAWINPACADK